MLLLFIGTTQTSFIPLQENEIIWYTIEEAEEKAKKDPRPIFIDVYTDWCYWCKKMDQSTFKKKEVVKYLNTHFYPVKFDAESKKDIFFEGKTFKKEGRMHALAKRLLDNDMRFPNLTFYQVKDKKSRHYPEYLKAKNFLKLLKYIKDEHYTTTTWESYRKK